MRLQEPINFDLYQDERTINTIGLSEMTINNVHIFQFRVFQSLLMSHHYE